MEKKISAALEKLNKSLSAIAESMTQLQLDIAKIGARVVAIDTEIASIGRHLGREKSESGEEANRRDLELEREVFGRMGMGSTCEPGEKGASKRPRKSAKTKATKRSGKPAAKR